MRSFLAPAVVSVPSAVEFNCSWLIISSLVMQRL
jgi:hypothetical protein